MTDRNNSIDNKEGSTQEVQELPEVTNYNWLITDIRRKMEFEIKSPTFCLVSDPSLKLKLIFTKQKKTYINSMDCTFLHFYDLGVEFDFDQLKYSFPIPHIFEFRVGSDKLVSITKQLVLPPGTIEKDDLRRSINNFICNYDLFYYLNCNRLEIRLKVKPFLDTNIQPVGNFLQKTETNFETFLNNEHLSDVTFHVGEQEFKAHKVILASVSPFFAKQFSESEGNSVANIEISICLPNVFNEMLRYIYTGRVENFKSVVFDLYKFANMIGISGLIMSCENYLVNNLSDENVVEIFECAYFFHSATLKERCIRYIEDNLHNVTETVSFKNMNKELLVDLFCSTRGAKKQRIE